MAVAPDRFSIFNYAHMPARFKTQRQINDADMPTADVKLAILMGLLLGLPLVLVALFLAFFFGAIIGVILMVFEKKGLKSEIPFGPFLITGTFLAMLYGNQIIGWYLRLFLI